MISIGTGYYSITHPEFVSFKKDNPLYVYLALGFIFVTMIFVSFSIRYFWNFSKLPPVIVFYKLDILFVFNFHFMPRIHKFLCYYLVTPYIPSCIDGSNNIISYIRFWRSHCGIRNRYCLFDNTYHVWYYC